MVLPVKNRLSHFDDFHFSLIECLDLGVSILIFEIPRFGMVKREREGRTDSGSVIDFLEVID